MTLLTPMLGATDSFTFWICCASSRVGARTRQVTTPGLVLPGARAGNVEYFLWLRKIEASAEPHGDGHAPDGANPG